jgi:hypothetical protein
MSNEQKKSKTVNAFASWTTPTSVRLALSEVGVAYAEPNVKRVIDCSRAEMARQVEQEVILPTVPLLRHFLVRLESALIVSLEPGQETAAHDFIEALGKDFTPRTIAVATGMPDEDKNIAMAMAVKIPNMKAAPRKLTGSELLDAIWTPKRPQFLPEKNSPVGEATPLPAGVLVTRTEETLLLNTEDIWRRILAGKNLDSDHNLAQALNWASHFGFEIFKSLPAQDRMDIASGRIVHARAVNPKKKTKKTKPELE